MTTTQTDRRPPIADFRWLTGTHDTRMFGTARITRRDVIAALGGMVVGAAGAAFYYDQTMRPLAHTLQMWVLLVAVVATRQPPLRGALQGAVAMLTSVLSFYLGKAVIYGQLYPGTSYDLDWVDIAGWVVLGILGGSLLGLTASRMGQAGWLSVAATSVLVGFLVIDGYARFRDYGEVLPLWIAAAGASLLIAIGVRSRAQLTRLAITLGPALLVGYGAFVLAEVISK